MARSESFLSRFSMSSLTADRAWPGSPTQVRYICGLPVHRDGVEVEFDIGVRENDAARVAPFQDHLPLSGQLALDRVRVIPHDLFL